MSKDHDQLKAVPVRQRSAARLAAIQIIYQSLITGNAGEKFISEYLSYYAAEVSNSFRVKFLDKKHLMLLLNGVEVEQNNLDKIIGEALSEGWSVDRLALIELAVLRCGAFELTPPPS